MTSAAFDRLRAIKIFNGPNALTVAVANGYTGPDIVLLYIPADNGRGGHSAYWLVSSPSHQTDPGGHWRDYGRKTFYLFGRGTHAEVKAEALAQAQAWAAERYGVTAWSKVPGLPGALLPTEAAAVVQRLVKAQQR